MTCRACSYTDKPEPGIHGLEPLGPFIELSNMERGVPGGERLRAARCYACPRCGTVRLGEEELASRSARA